MSHLKFCRSVMADQSSQTSKRFNYTKLQYNCNRTEDLGMIFGCDSHPKFSDSVKVIFSFVYELGKDTVLISGHYNSNLRR